MPRQDGNTGPQYLEEGPILGLPYRVLYGFLQGLHVGASMVRSSFLGLYCSTSLMRSPKDQEEHICSLDSLLTVSSLQ